MITQEPRYLVREYADGERLYVVPDSRGESADYEAYSLHAYRDGRIVWVEGIRKDRTDMHPAWREPIELVLSSLITK